MNKELWIRDVLTKFVRIGYMTRKGSFRLGDLKAISNPKWQKNVEKFFSKTKFDINLYILNATDGFIHCGNEQIDIIRAVSQYKTDWCGNLSIKNTKRLLNGLPHNWRNSITVILSQNEGDNRFPLTPWMVAHRMSHATFHNTKENFCWDEFLKSVTKAMGMRIHSSYEDKARAIIPMMKFRSAREDNLPRPLEIIHELFAQYILNDGITFNKIKFSPPFHEDWYKYDNENFYEQKNLDETLNKWEIDLTLAFEKHLQHCVGKVFIL